MLFSNCSNKESKKIADYPLYLNTPVTYQDADIIGFETIVSSLNSAISQGAQMIAITSPFGTGKTSVIELLKTQRSIDGKTKSIPNEKIIKIPMWSQTANKEMSSLELHRHLVYEIAKGINPKKGTYIQRRLSHNYGLIKIHINKFRFLIYCTFAIGLWTLGKVIGEQITWITKLISGIDDYLPAISIGLKAIGVLIGLVPVIKSEVIVSTIKSEKDRKIEEDEIIDLYRNEVLQPYKFLYNLPCFQSQKKKYIVVIEDLDRSNSTKSVQDFLRELRKYYTEEQNQSRYLNSVVFIINIKPESLLFKHSQDPASNENEMLYAKLFDYVLDLQTINIDDYDTILESLLEKERTSLSSLGIIDSQYHGRITNIAGMQWLIRGKKLDIRMIKHRINKAIILYCSLKKRFNGDVSFEKCAVFSYLTTEYEEEFNLTDDKSYGKLAELRIKSEITVEQCQDIINVNNNDYLRLITRTCGS